MSSDFTQSDSDPSAPTAASSDAAAYCAALVREQDFDRYAATLFAPPASRRALLALAAFNVEIVRIRDQVTQPLPGEVRLQWWSDLLAGTAHGGAEGHPVAAELLQAIAAHHLPVDPLLLLIEAHQFDLYNDPMPDLATLQAYLDATVGGLLSLSAALLGAEAGSAAHAAHHAGVAIGMVRLLVALPRDSSRRQLFLPFQVFADAGSGLEEAFAGQLTPALRAALNVLITEAGAHLYQATALLNDTPAAARFAFLTLALARRDLDHIGHTTHNPFTLYQPSRLSSLWTLWRASRSGVFRGD